MGAIGIMATSETPTGVAPMLKSPVDYANMLYVCALEDADKALELAIDASRAHDIVPASYFVDVIKHLISFAS